MSANRPAFRIGYEIVGSEKWGWDVLLFDPKERDESSILLTPERPASIGWATPLEARKTAAEALRNLADSIEWGEP